MLGLRLHGLGLGFWELGLQGLRVIFQEISWNFQGEPFGEKVESPVSGM